MPTTPSYLPSTPLSRRWLGVLSAALSAWGGSVALGQSYWARDDWTRNFRLGLQVTFNIKADFSLEGTIPTNSGDPGLPGVPGLNHHYDDGYVLIDDTKNAGGYTSNWGYRYASQYDAATDELVFKNSRSFTTHGNDVVDASPYFGLELAYGGRIHDWREVRLGWEFGYSYLPLNIQESNTLPATFERVVQSFSVGGISLPTAPYAGGPSGLGPLLTDTARERPSEIVPGLVSGTRSIDVGMHAFRLGPTLFWRFQPLWALSGSIGPAMALLNGAYEFDEVFTFDDGTRAHNVGQDNGTEFVWGGYASATILFRVVADADLFLSAQFMSLTDATYSSTGRSAELKLGTTVSTMIGISWPF